MTRVYKVVRDHKDSFDILVRCQVTGRHFSEVKLRLNLWTAKILVKQLQQMISVMEAELPPE